MNHDDEKFLSRWSQRKAEARKGREEPEEPEENTAASDEAPENEMLTESDFDDVDFESLDKSSDYTRFIRANVPDNIQKLALRKLWSSDPVFEVMDGMNDYDEDFTGNGLAGKALKSAYKIGKGYLLDEEDDNAPEKTQETAENKDSPAQAAPASASGNTEPGSPGEIPDGK